MLKLVGREKENNFDGLLKPKINNFLINYFNYFILAVSVIIFAVGLWLFVYPLYQQISSEDEAARKNLLTEYEAKQKYLNYIVKLKQSYRSISEEDKARFQSMVPEQSDVSDLIYIMESIALKNGVVLNSLKIEPESPKGQAGRSAPAGGNESAGKIFEQLPAGASRIKISASLSSVNYQILKNVIKTFENNLRLLDIAKVDYGVNENKVSLEIYSYYLPR